MVSKEGTTHLIRKLKEKNNCIKHIIIIIIVILLLFAAKTRTHGRREESIPTLNYKFIFITIIKIQHLNGVRCA